MFLQVTMTETKDCTSTSSSDSPKQCRGKTTGKTKEKQSSNRSTCTGTTSENMHRTPTNKKSRPLGLDLHLSNALSKDNHRDSSQTSESSGSYDNLFCANLVPDKTSCASDETLSWRDWLKRTLGFGNSPGSEFKWH